MRSFCLYLFSLSFVLFGFVSSRRQLHKQQRDYKVFTVALLEKEGTLDLHTSMDSILHSFEELKTGLEQKRSYMEQYRLFSYTTAKIQCGHTQFFPWTRKTLMEWFWLKNSLPIDYIMVGKKLFSQKIISEDKKTLEQGKTKAQQKVTIPPDCEIISINNHTVPEMMKAISPYLSSDEDGMDFKYFQVSQFFEFYRQVAYPEKMDSTKVVYVSKKDTVEVYLQNGFPPFKTMQKRIGKSEATTQKNTKDIGKFSIQKSKYGYFKFVSFANARGTKYEEFLKKSFTTLKKKKIKYLIVDVRGNLGGQMQVSFMRYIVGPNIKIGRYEVMKPHERFKSRTIKRFNSYYLNHRFLSWFYKYKRKKEPDYDGAMLTEKVDEDLIYKGKIIVITDEGSFSASSALACNLKTLAHAKIAGHTAGGSFYKGNSGTLKVILPESGFTFFVNPNTYWSNIPDNTDHQSIKKPDYIIDPIYPGSKKKDDWYLNKVMKCFK